MITSDGYRELPLECREVSRREFDYRGFKITEIIARRENHEGRLVVIANYPLADIRPGETYYRLILCLSPFERLKAQGYLNWLHFCDFPLKIEQEIEVDDGVRITVGFEQVSIVVQDAMRRRCIASLAVKLGLPVDYEALPESVKLPTV